MKLFKSILRLTPLVRFRWFRKWHGGAWMTYEYGEWGVEVNGEYEVLG